MKLSSEDCKNFIIGLLIADNEISKDVKTCLGLDAPPLDLLEQKSWKCSQKYTAFCDDDVASKNDGVGCIDHILGVWSSLSNVEFSDSISYPLTIRVFRTTVKLELKYDAYEEEQIYETYVRVWLVSDVCDEKIVGASLHMDYI